MTAKHLTDLAGFAAIDRFSRDPALRPLFRLWAVNMWTLFFIRYGA